MTSRTNKIRSLIQRARPQQPRTAQFDDSLERRPVSEHGHPGAAALMLVREALSQFDLPSQVDVEYKGMKRLSGHGQHNLRDGLIEVRVAFSSLSGAKHHIEVPVVVHAGYMVFPEVFTDDHGNVSVMAQSAFDDMLKQGDVHRRMQDRANMYSPHITHTVNIEEPVVGSGMFSVHAEVEHEGANPEDPDDLQRYVDQMTEWDPNDPGAPGREPPLPRGRVHPVVKGKPHTPPKGRTVPVVKGQPEEQARVAQLDIGEQESILLEQLELQQANGDMEGAQRTRDAIEDLHGQHKSAQAWRGKGTEDMSRVEPGMRVGVYGNRTVGTFSIVSIGPQGGRGRVIGYGRGPIYLDDAEFVVEESGRERVRREKKRYVHAYVVGTVSSDTTPIGDAGAAYYNPYQTDEWVDFKDQSRGLTHAPRAVLYFAGDGRPRVEYKDPDTGTTEAADIKDGAPARFEMAEDFYGFPREAEHSPHGLDPAERSVGTHRPGQKVKLVMDVAVRTRGGAVLGYDAGTEVCIIRDAHGDGLQYYVEFPDRRRSLVHYDALPQAKQAISRFINFSGEDLPPEQGGDDSALLQELGYEGASDDDDPCWEDYEQVGMKDKDGKEVPNCVPKRRASPQGARGVHFSRTSGLTQLSSDFMGRGSLSHAER